MPPASDPNRTTKVLAGLLGLSLLLLGGLIALTEHNKAMAALKAAKMELSARRDAHLIILAEEQQALARDAWIRANQPALSDPATASGALLDFVKQTAQEAGVELSATKLLEPSEGAAGPEIGIEVQATAPFEKAVRLLHALQAPERFVTITKLSLKSDAEPPNVVLELRLVRHYARSAASE